MAGRRELKTSPEDATDERSDSGFALPKLREGGLPSVDQGERALVVPEHLDEAVGIRAVSELPGEGSVRGEHHALHAVVVGEVRQGRQRAAVTDEVEGSASVLHGQVVTALQRFD